MPLSDGVSARVKLLVAALLFSTGGAAIKATSLTGWQVACVRSGIAAVAVLILSRSARRGWSWRSWLVGITYAATLVLYVLAKKPTTSANTIFLQATAPLYMVFLGPLLLGERVRAKDLFVMAAVGAGRMLVVAGHDAPVATAPNPGRGNLFAALSGLTWALTVCGLRWVSEDDGKGRLRRWRSGGRGGQGNLVAALATLPFAWPITGARTTDWLVLVYLGVFQIGIAYILVTTALRRVTAIEASILLLLEPALNPLFAWLVHHETPSGFAVAGGVIILAATTLRTWLDARSPAEAG